MSGYSPKAKPLGVNAKIKLNLSNYATKAYLKNVAVINTSDFAK